MDGLSHHDAFSCLVGNRFRLVIGRQDVQILSFGISQIAIGCTEVPIGPFRGHGIVSHHLLGLQIYMNPMTFAVESQLLFAGIHHREIGQ